MIDLIRNLIQSLREELQNYGEMLALLDHQQEMVISRAADEVIHTAASIQAQGTVMQCARLQREQCFQALASALPQPGTASFSQVIPLVPEEYQPLLKALVQENNELLIRIQNRARQNHLLLSRSLELMQRFINSLIPASRPSVYSDSGVILEGSLMASSLYQAVG
jgi:hypothetical protein